MSTPLHEPVAAPELAEAIGAAVAGLSWTSSLEALAQADAAVLALLRAAPTNQLRLTLPSAGRLKDAPTIAHLFPPPDKVRLVEFCFDAGLRRSLGYALDAQGLPVDGCYMTTRQGKASCSTLLAMAIDQLGLHVSIDRKWLPDGVQPDFSHANVLAPYADIAIDMIDRGASRSLLPISGDYSPPHNAAHIVSMDTPSALLRAFKRCVRITGIGECPAPREQLLDVVEAISAAGDIWGTNQLLLGLANGEYAHSGINDDALRLAIDRLALHGFSLDTPVRPGITALQHAVLSEAPGGVITLAGLGANLVGPMVNDVGEPQPETIIDAIADRFQDPALLALVRATAMRQQSAAAWAACASSVAPSSQSHSLERRQRRLSL